MPSASKAHRRALRYGKPANIRKRNSPSVEPIKRQKIPNEPSFYRKRGDGDDPSSANNLASMQEFVSELMQMNKDWQEQSMQKLKEGKSPDEFSWDEFNKQSKDFSDYGKDDTSDTSAEDRPPSSSTSSQDSSSSESETTTPNPKQKPQQKPKTKEQPKSQPKQEPKPQAKEEQKPKPKPKPKPQPKPKSQPKEESKAKEVPQSDPKPQQNNNNGDYSKGNTGTGGVVAQHGFAGKRMKGEMTYFTPDLGACGNTNTESDFIVAASAELFNIFGGGMSNGNPICGHKIRIYKNGKSAVAEIQDECPPCRPPSIDMSPALFKYFENLDVGRTSVEWEFI